MRLLAGSFVLLSASAFGSIASTFDTDTDNWFLTNVDVNTWTPSGASAATWGASFGNPGGGVQVTDAFGWTWLANNSQFSGNLSAYSGGTFSYDFFTSPGRDNVEYPLAAIASTSGVIFIQGIAPDAGSWNTRTVSLTPGEWIYFNGVTSAPADQGQIDAVLSSVVGVYIDVDVLSGADSHRLDNIRLDAVPEPGSLIALGLGLLAARRRAR